VFYRSQRNTIEHVYYDTTKGLLADPPWAGPGSKTNAPAAGGNPAALYANSQQHVFYRTVDNALQHVFYDETSHDMTSEAWTVPGAILGDPCTMATSNQQHVFYRLHDNSVMHAFYDTSTKNRTIEYWGMAANARTPLPVATGNPVTMVTGDQQHVFYRSVAQDLVHQYWDPASGLHAERWAGRFTDNGGPSGDCAVMVTGSNQQQHAFYISGSNELMQVFTPPANSKEVWVAPYTSNANATKTNAPQLNTRPATMLSSQQNVFYQALNGDIFEASSNPAAKQLSVTLLDWTSQFTNPANPPSPAGNPVVAVDDQQSMFYRAVDSEIYRAFNTPSTSKLSAEPWTGPKAHGTAPKAVGDPATLVTANQLHLFYRSTTDQIVHVFRDHSSPLTVERWAGPGSSASSPAPAGDPATLYANNQQHVFYLTIAAGIYHVFGDSSKGLQAEPWVGPDAPIPAPLAASSPATMATRDQQHIFYRGTDGRIYHVYWDQQRGLQWEQWNATPPDWVTPWTV
jgi:hypothetical protein